MTFDTEGDRFGSLKRPLLPFDNLYFLVLRRCLHKSEVPSSECLWIVEMGAHCRRS